MLLTQENARRMTQELDLPALEVELERAIWQVENAIRKQNETSQSVKVEEEKAKNTAGTGVVLPGPGKDKKRQ